jgi:hypothetical protein
MRRMQGTIEDLQRQLGHKGSVGGLGGDSGDLEKVELEVKLRNAEIRIEAL